MPSFLPALPVCREKPNPFINFLIRSLFLYACFLIPTGYCLLNFGVNDALLSLKAVNVWQAEFWHFIGLSAFQSRIVLDSIQAAGIGLLGYLFFNYTRTEGFKSLSESKVFWATVLFSFLLVAVIPFHSSDLYGYLNRGFQQSVFRVNPYVTTVSQIPGWQNTQNAVLLHPHWVDNPCPYGVFFAFFVKHVTVLGAKQFLPSFLILKTCSAIALIASTWLVGKTATLLQWANPWQAAFWLGCNPLVLTHAVANGHNDILMMALLLLALFILAATGAHVKKQVKPKGFYKISILISVLILLLLVLPLFTLSALTKYATAIALPVVLVLLFRKKQYHILFWGGLLSVLLAAALFWPYLYQQQWQWADIISNAGKPQHSLVAMAAQALYYPVKWLGGPAEAIYNTSLAVLKPISLTLFAGLVVVQVFQFSRNSQTKAKHPGHWPLVQEAIEKIAILLTGLLLCSAKFHPWYIVMILPVVLLLSPQSRLRQFWCLVSVTQLAAFTVFQNLPVFSQLVLFGLPVYLVLKKSPLKDNAHLTTPECNN
ncbi:MAG: hypothetical protein AAGI66_04920 [Cyanobacteria bacterium P01_H01_bin.74]